jgi:hypothetical protein
MVRVAFNELQAERASETGTDQALPGAAHAHDDVEPAVHREEFIAAGSNPRRYGASGDKTDG